LVRIGIGTRVGPVWVGASTRVGGRRRRRSSSGDGLASLLAIAIAIALVVFAVAWPLFVWQAGATRWVIAAAWWAFLVSMPFLIRALKRRPRTSRSTFRGTVSKGGQVV
jgi:hypothetical protein